MNSTGKTHRALGFAFLFQAVASLVSGAFLRDPLIVTDDVAATLTKIADHTAQMRAAMLGDTLTALGIVYLGVYLFVLLRQHNEIMARTALGFYIVEAAILVISRLDGFALLSISEQYAAATGQPDYLLASGQTALDTLDFGFTLHMIVFCLGAPLFYYLIIKAGILPRALAWWGLVTIFPMLFAMILVLFDYDAVIALFLPYAPFEFVTGVWILVRGLRDDPTRSETV